MSKGDEDTTTIRVRKTVRDELKRIAMYDDSTLFLVADDILGQALDQLRNQHPVFSSPRGTGFTISVRTERKRT